MFYFHCRLPVGYLAKVILINKRMSVTIFPGSPYPLGATWDGEGVNFAVFSQNASGIELCLYDAPTEIDASVRLHMK